MLATTPAIGTNPLYNGLVAYNSDPDLPKTGIPTRRHRPGARLQLTSDLAKSNPVFFLGDSGHELYNSGARTYLVEEFDLATCAVFHLGSALAG